VRECGTPVLTELRVVPHTLVDPNGRHHRRHGRRGEHGLHRDNVRAGLPALPAPVRIGTRFFEHREFPGDGVDGAAHQRRVTRMRAEQFGNVLESDLPVQQAFQARPDLTLHTPARGRRGKDTGIHQTVHSHDKRIEHHHVPRIVGGIASPEVAEQIGRDVTATGGAGPGE